MFEEPDARALAERVVKIFLDTSEKEVSGSDTNLGRLRADDQYASEREREQFDMQRQQLDATLELARGATKKDK